MVNREIKARKRAVKEEKEEIDGEIVRIRKGHPRTNLPVKLPENPTWLKQPNENSCQNLFVTFPM